MKKIFADVSPGNMRYYFTVKCLSAKLQIQSFPICVSKYSTASYFHIRMFCNLFIIGFVLDGLL